MNADLWSGSRGYPLMLGHVHRIRALYRNSSGCASVVGPVQVISEVYLKSHVALVPFIRDGGFVLSVPFLD